ncbi:two pore domain potassium channel family protein [Streptomyces sp. PSKA28]|uniref:Two pore domain potassium channel family protein n=2 Tax=Streptomyces TaxID=1883 RepID=A0A7W0I8Y1_9ACTN|nr:two pore domain potassium channel family protein [Streptomyces himalayensis subsp. himalayensis]
MPGMLPGFLAKVVESLLGREGRSLHLKAAGGATVVLAVTMLMGSWAVVAAERGAPGAGITTYPKALWWSVETATTVGYGDLYPVTLGGRIVATVVMAVGITTYGMVTAAIATWFVGREQKRQGHLRAAAEAAERAAHRMCDETALALHERFDRLERALARHDGGGGGHG